MSIGLENIYTGQSDKIYHGKAPVKIGFRPKINRKVHLNIDGEFYELNHPEYIKITAYDKIKSHQLTFIRKKA